MASTHTCDICDTEVEDGHLGALIVRGVDVNDPKKLGRIRRRFIDMDLCPTCSIGAYRAVLALIEEKEQRDHVEEEVGEWRATC